MHGIDRGSVFDPLIECLFRGLCACECEYYRGGEFNPQPVDFLRASFRYSRVDLQSYAQRKRRDGTLCFLNCVWSTADRRAARCLERKHRWDTHGCWKFRLCRLRCGFQGTYQAAILTDSGRRRSGNEPGKLVLERSACRGMGASRAGTTEFCGLLAFALRRNYLLHEPGNRFPFHDWTIDAIQSGWHGCLYRRSI